MSSIRRLVNRPWRRRANVADDAGTTLLEFAIAGMLFVMLTMGILELGRAVWAYNSLAHAAREGSRFAIVRGTDSGRTASTTDVQNFVRGRISSFTGVTVTTTWTPNTNPGSTVQVRVQYAFEPVVPLFPSIPLTATSRMLITF